MRRLAVFPPNRESLAEVILMLVERGSCERTSLSYAEPELVLQRLKLLHELSPASRAGEKWIGGHFDEALEIELNDPAPNAIQETHSCLLNEGRCADGHDLAHREFTKPLQGVLGVVFISEAAASNRND